MQRLRATRRAFVKAAGATLLTSSVPRPVGKLARASPDGPDSSAPVETSVARFYRTLSADQRAQICFPSDHPLRSKARNNWAIVKPSIGDMTGEQKALCLEVFKGLCSEEGHTRFRRQMVDDQGGFERYHVAIFGEPGTTKPFEWVLTGRHVTLRADGSREGGASCVGPIFFGHGADRPSNVWSDLDRRANAIFEALDDHQKAEAVSTGNEPGLVVAGLDGSRKRMVQQLLEGLRMPFRALEAEEIQKCLRDPSGADTLRLTFFEERDAGDDQARHIWKLEGPAFAWYFHGSPHVHSWVDFARRESDD